MEFKAWSDNILNLKIQKYIYLIITAKTLLLEKFNNLFPILNIIDKNRKFLLDDFNDFNSLN